MKIKQPKLSLILGLITLAVIFRIMPHWPNFTPVAAIALMSGALISNRMMAFVIPFLAIAISDFLTVILINSAYITPAEYFSSPALIFSYAAYAFMVLMGMGISKKLQWSVLGLASLSTATVFFLLSNFGYWLTSTLPKTALGLGLAYEMGVPFYLNNLAGDLFYTFVLFGSVAILTERFQTLRLQTK
ncbi:MAG: DUF6580 family putative transport protein [Flavobacteriales bacterium]